MKINLGKVKNQLMTGMSYMIPLTVIGGIFYAGAIAFGGTAVKGQGMVITNEFWLHVQQIGEAGLSLMVPILAGYIAYSIAGKPGLAPGLVAGYIANSNITISGNEVKTGFLGALILGFLTGYLVQSMKKIKYPNLIKSVVPILIIPVVTSFVVCILYMYVLAMPVGYAMGGIESFLTSLSSGSKVLLGIVMGMMVTFDMGGPINKTACLFSIGMMTTGHYEFFGICAVPICTAPLGMGIATLLDKRKYTQEERDAGKASLFMGMIGISEGAIPLAVADPARVIPSIMVGGAVGGAIAAVTGVKDYAPHGGPIVLPIIDEKIWFVIAIIIGTVVTAVLVNLLKKPVEEKQEEVLEVKE